jgi:pyruvate/2-oxoglutarate/acetoin dehydrogenase E1 component
MTPYLANLRIAMALIAERPDAIFIGQSVVAGGTAMGRSLDHVDPAIRLELPVFEDTQLGMATGLALAGYLPVCVYPRINFLLLAINQLVLHLDKLPVYSDGGYRPRVIVRTGIATPDPLDPGPQHLGDFTEALSMMLQTVKVERLETAEQILPAYRQAIECDGSTLMVELLERY